MPSTFAAQGGEGKGTPQIINVQKNMHLSSDGRRENRRLRRRKKKRKSHLRTKMHAFKKDLLLKKVGRGKRTSKVSKDRSQRDESGEKSTKRPEITAP